MRLLFLVLCAISVLNAPAQKDGMAKREAKVRKQLAKGKAYKAISLCNGALGIEDRPVFHVLRADARNRIGEFAVAERDARQAFERLPNDREALLQLAIAEQGLGNADSAVAHYHKLLATGADPNVHYRLATALQGRKDYPAALTQLSGALAALPAEDPAVPKVLRSRAECMALSGDTAGSRAAFQRALDLVPNDPVILNSRAWFLHAAYGDHTSAIADYNRAIKQNPNYSYAFNNRGWSKFKNGDTAGALKDINLARKKKPFNPYIYRNLGLIALQRGDTSEACTQFRHALELNFTAVHGDEVERLVLEHCREQVLPRPQIPGNAPGEPVRTAPPTRTNAPE
jgi:tetratricopeptide (TPR) repeat protein